jgi:hypothetical protein
MQAMNNAMRAGYQSYKPEPVMVPALAIYAMPKTADDLLRRGSSDRRPFPELSEQMARDTVLRGRVEQLFDLTRQRVRKHEQWFEQLAERRQIVELSGPHDLIASNPSEVLDALNGFVGSLEDAR